MKTRCLIAGMTTGVSTTCGAADAAPGVAFGPGLLQATLGLAVVLGLIWGAAWLLRRIAPTGAPSRSPIKIIAAQSLGQREKVVLVEFADNWLLLGVTPGQITALQTLAKSVLPEPTPIAAPFARLFALAKHKREG